MASDAAPRPEGASEASSGNRDAQTSEVSASGDAQTQTGSKEGGLPAAGDAPGQGEPHAKGESHAQGEHQAVSESHGQGGSESEGGGARAEGERDATGPEADAGAAARASAPGLETPPQGTFWTGEPEAGKEGAAAEDTPDDEEAPADVLAAPEERLAGRVTTVLLPLEKLQDDTAFRLRPEGDVSGLATDIARLGQLFPVDVRPAGEDRYQLVCGFRRVAALRFLKRDAVQARIHLRLTDEDALVMSLAEAIHATPVGPEVLEAKRDELEAQGRLSAAVRDMLEKALATEDTLAPEGVEEEIDADELAQEVAQRLGAINQDLSLLADVFAALDESRKAELLMQLRYSSELVTYLEGL
ncbi:ParB N-terminal domain-containing protein [Pseudomyxococcus flavus]